MNLQGQELKAELAAVHAPGRHTLSTCIEYDVSGGVHAGPSISGYGPKSAVSAEAGSEAVLKLEGFNV